MKNLTVFHIDKGKGSGAALGNHIDRTEGKEHSYKNADLSKSHLNIDIGDNKHSKKPLHVGVRDRIKEGYTGKRKVRSDAVKYMKVVLGGSHEKMKDIEARGDIESWAKDSVSWLSDKFGKENVVKAVLHLDERTPHIHAVIVPLIQETFTYENKDKETITVEKGALSAKEILRSPSMFRGLHTNYYEEVGAKYGLIRGEMRKPGEEKTPVTTLNEFYHQVNKAKDLGNLEFKYPEIDTPSRLVVLNPEKWAVEQNENIKESLSEFVSGIQERLSEQTFRTAAEVIRESKYKEDIKIRAALLRRLNESKQETQEAGGKNIVLKKRVQDLAQKTENGREIIKDLLEGRVSNRQVKEIAKSVGAKMPRDKDNSLNI